MEYVQMTLDDWVNMKEKLRRDLNGVAESFVRIGYTLRRIKEGELYKQDGYEDIQSFAKQEYNLSPSTVSRFMAINEKYSIDGYSEALRPEFAGIGSSKLAEMLTLPDQDLELIRPNTTRESIRELKEFNRQEPEEGGQQDIVEQFWAENRELQKELESSRAFAEKDLEELVYLVNPSGNRTFRKGIHFLMMYSLEEGLKTKVFDGAVEPMSWQEFFDRTRAVLEREALAPAQENPEEPRENTEETDPETQPERTKSETEETEPEEGQPAAGEAITGRNEPEFDPQPEKRVSICYTCLHYPKCEEKSATVETCGEYRKKAEAEKTEEQRYEEEQARLDRETKRKLREQADKEKMRHLPSDTKSVIQIRVTDQELEDLASDRKRFLLLKKDPNFREGSRIQMIGFRDGRTTGRVAKVVVTYLLEEYTGLEEDYCILGIKEETA